MCSLFAATYPEMTLALVMIGTYAKRIRDDDYPWGPTIEQREAFLELMRREWGGPVGIDDRAPSRATDLGFRDWWAACLRVGASPSAAVALTKMSSQIDTRAILPTIRVQSLVIHRRGCAPRGCRARRRRGRKDLAGWHSRDTGRDPLAEDIVCTSLRGPSLRSGRQVACVALEVARGPIGTQRISVSTSPHVRREPANPLVDRRDVRRVRDAKKALAPLAKGDSRDHEHVGFRGCLLCQLQRIVRRDREERIERAVGWLELERELATQRVEKRPALGAELRAHAVEPA